VFTVMPAWPNSLASAVHMAARRPGALYIAWSTSPLRTDSAPMFTIRP